MSNAFNTSPSLTDAKTEAKRLPQQEWNKLSKDDNATALKINAQFQVYKQEVQAVRMSDQSDEVRKKAVLDLIRPMHRALHEFRMGSDYADRTSENLLATQYFMRLNPHAYLELAEDFFLIGIEPLALDYLDTAIKQGDHDARLRRGQYYFERKEWERAADDLIAASDPPDPVRHQILLSLLTTIANIGLETPNILLRNYSETISSNLMAMRKAQNFLLHSQIVKAPPDDKEASVALDTLLAANTKNANYVWWIENFNKAEKPNDHLRVWQVYFQVINTENFDAKSIADVDDDTKKKLFGILRAQMLLNKNNPTIHARNLNILTIAAKTEHKDEVNSPSKGSAPHSSTVALPTTQQAENREAKTEATTQRENFSTPSGASSAALISLNDDFSHPAATQNHAATMPRSTASARLA